MLCTYTLVHLSIHILYYTFAFVLFFVAAVCVSTEQWNATLSVDLGTELTIVCGLSANFPSWRGPPLFDYKYISYYNYEGSAVFNSDLGQEKLSRMSWATNNRDLRLSPVTLDEMGVYVCSYNVHYWSVKVELRGRFWLTMYSNEHNPFCF